MFSTPPLIPTASQPVIRFGWWKKDHEIINVGALHQLPSSPWQTYLGRHLPRIEYVDDTQDVFERGPKHFINLEAITNEWLLKKPEAYPTWHNVDMRFKPKTRKKITKDWNNSLKHMHVPQGSNTITSILNAYQNSVETYQKLTQANPFIPEKQQESWAMDLDESLGELMHYVGDLYMPLHTSQYFDWKIFGEQGLHEFIEGKLLSSKDYQQILQKAEQNKSALPEVTPQTLKPFITQEIRRTHMQIFKIVDICRKVKKQFPEETTAPKIIEQELRKRLKPLIAKQLTQAQTSLATLLQLVQAEGLKGQSIH